MSNIGAQNKLGELFVDIGVGGLADTLKALNSVSASFLLTKNAASQAIAPIINIGNQAMNSAVGIGKMAAALGTTSINAQKLQYYLKKYDAQGVENSIGGLQQVFTRLRGGTGGISGDMATTFNQLFGGTGKVLQDYDGSFESTLKFIQDVKEAFKTKGISPEKQVMHLQNLGLDTQFAYLFQKEDFNLGDALKISDDDLKKLQKSNEEIKETKNTIDQIAKKGTVNVLEHGGSNFLKEVNEALSGDKKSGAKAATRGVVAIGGAGLGGEIGAAVGSVGGPVGSILGWLIGAGAMSYLSSAGLNKVYEDLDSKKINKSVSNKSGIFNGFAYDIMNDDAIPSPIKDIDNIPNVPKEIIDEARNINVNISPKIYNKGSDDLQYEVDIPDIESNISMNAYVSHNQAGV